MRRSTLTRRLAICGGAVIALVAAAGAGGWAYFSMPAAAPAQLEYLPANGTTVESTEPRVTTVAANSVAGVVDFSGETVGAEPASFLAVVGRWVIGVDGDKHVLVVDGRKWEEGQPSAGLADKARALYGERYAEFLDNVQSYAYFPYAVDKSVDDFQGGEISLRFKPIAGRIDQAAGILFNLKPNGDYLTLRANALENNLVLWQVVHGKRSSVEWVRGTPDLTPQWHDLKVVINGTRVEGYLDGKLYLTHSLPQPVSGHIGIWSKADSVVYFDDFTVKPAN
jgi:hypothetical protein